VPLADPRLRPPRAEAHLRRTGLAWGPLASQTIKKKPPLDIN
jgi:hypothetical protein